MDAKTWMLYLIIMFAVRPICVQTPLSKRLAQALKNTWKRELVELPVSEKFSWLFYACFEISIWNLVYTHVHLVGSATHQVRISSQSGHADLLYSQKCVKVIFLHLWPEQLYRAFSYGTHTYIVSRSVLIFFMAGEFLAPCRPQTLRRGISAELPATRKFSEFLIQYGQ